MVALLGGKSFNNSFASEVNDPRFFEYRGGSFINQLAEVSFGWFKKLNDQQSLAYHRAISVALHTADYGHSVKWYIDDASGTVMPVAHIATGGGGYCRRMHISVIAHGIRKNFQETACYDNAHDNWRWLPNK
jgi:surface antigen